MAAVLPGGRAAPCTKLCGINPSIEKVKTPYGFFQSWVKKTNTVSNGVLSARAKNLRISRTGGVALRTQVKAAGLIFTANSQHGLRVSTALGKGTQVALQNGRLVLRGRYGRSPTPEYLENGSQHIDAQSDRNL